MDPGFLIDAEEAFELLSSFRKALDLASNIEHPSKLGLLSEDGYDLFEQHM